jgi:hypothetical protein
MSIEIRELPADPKRDKKLLRDFVDLVDEVYEGDPAYVRPLDMEMEDRLDRAKNPFYEHAEVAAWVAYKDGERAGRVTAQVCRQHLDRYKDDAGFFGFLDTVNDPEVAAALLDKAASWVKARGMKKLRGPLSFSINDETGVLVDGFDTPPMVMMPHHRPYQSKLIEHAGFTKLKDFYAWDYEVGVVPPRAQKAHDEISAMPEITARPVDPSRVREDIGTIMSIFNDAWSDNWGFVPLTEKELEKLAEDTKILLMPELTRIVFIDGEAAAVMMALPNLNEAIADLRGKIFPFGFAKLLWRLKVKGPATARLVILGIRKKWRHVRRYAALSAYLYVEVNRAAHLLGVRRGELSWTVEDNAPINVAIKMMGGKVYKTYRVYERELA